MQLSELKKGECGKIIIINSDSVLKARFSSFGITRGAMVYTIQQTMSKNTIEIRVNNTKIALRISEAKLIEVEKSECKI
ncbi:MAG: iron transporter [Arcobacter sp.]|nr:MAG: iron transporter [Arcobacter sp.]